METCLFQKEKSVQFLSVCTCIMMRNFIKWWEHIFLYVMLRVPQKGIWFSSLKLKYFHQSWIFFTDLVAFRKSWIVPSKSSERWPFMSSVDDEFRAVLKPLKTNIEQRKTPFYYGLRGIKHTEEVCMTGLSFIRLETK